MSGRQARKKRDEAKEPKDSSAAIEPTDEASNKEQEEKPEPTFEQKVFEKMQVASADFAKDADWEQLLVDYEDAANDERGRAWTFILYPDSMNPDTMNILSEHGIQGCISPLHDSDHWPDGSLKKAHFHVALYYPGKKAHAQVKALVDVLGGVMLQLVHNIVGLVRYFAHMDIQPSKVPADRGKVRYSPDDIVSFGGFDAQTYLKATQTQISRALGELYTIVREQDITAYCDLVDLIYTTMVDYMFVMSNPHVCNQLSTYIRSRYAKAHKDAELKAMAIHIQAQGNQIHTLMGGVSRMELVVDRLAYLITGEDLSVQVPTQVCGSGGGLPDDDDDPDEMEEGGAPDGGNDSDDDGRK
ncbi:MAG: replication protein [Olsenella sp.]|nr:replication protein [Olsenella sp.]